MRRSIGILLVLALFTVSLAQDQAGLLRAYLNTWNGTPQTAAIFQRYFAIEAGADWWAYLVESRKSWQLVETADSLAVLANNLGLGDGRVPGGDAVVDSWQGKLGVKLVLPSGLTREQKDEVMDNLALLCNPMSNVSVCRPRGGRFFLTVTFDAKASECEGSVSKDGNTYNFVFPTYARITTMPLETVFQKGL